MKLLHMIDSTHPAKGNSLDSANCFQGGRAAFIQRGEGTMGEGVLSWAGPHSADGTLASLAGLSPWVTGRFTSAVACVGGGKEVNNG